MRSTAARASREPDDDATGEYEKGYTNSRRAAVDRISGWSRGLRGAGKKREKMTKMARVKERERAKE